MATIGTAVRLNDMMSAPIHNITNAMNMMLSAWESLDATTAGGLDIEGVEAIRSELNSATRALDQLGNEQEEFNRTVQRGSDALDDMTDKILGAIGVYASLQGIQKLVNLSDTYTQTQARLSMIVDMPEMPENITEMEEMAIRQEQVDELNDKIFASAQRARASYQDMADTVAKLSLMADDAFGSNDETVLFAENLNKLFAIAGTEQQSIASATLQLTQALGSGVLRGEEFNAVLEAAPNIMQHVADYMDVPIGKLRSMAAEGQITADIVKNALLGATESINAQFESMPMTWGQVWTGVTNELYYASIPLLQLISALANNWSIIQPIVIGAAAALGIYTTALLVNNAITSGAALMNGIHAASTMLQSGATFAATVAQHGFNAALLACPITWIILAIILIIAAIYAVIAAINKAQGTTVSATGVIMGVVYSLFGFLWNIVASFVNFFANVWNDPIGSVVRLFASLVDNVLGMLELVAKGIDAVFGSNLADTVAGWRSGLSGLVEDEFGAGVEIMPTIDATESFSNGYEFGEGLGDKVGSFFGADTGAYDLDSLTDNVSGLSSGVGNISDSTGSIADSLNVTNENLKYLRDLAETEVVNRFTTAEIRVEMGGITNQVNQNADLDGIVDYMVTGVQEAMERVAEGVHA